MGTGVEFFWDLSVRVVVDVVDVSAGMDGRLGRVTRAKHAGRSV